MIHYIHKKNGKKCSRIVTTPLLKCTYRDNNARRGALSVRPESTGNKKKKFINQNQKWSFDRGLPYPVCSFTPICSGPSLNVWSLRGSLLTQG